MVQENILPVIDKLTSAGITLTELNEIKLLIDTEEFTKTYTLVDSLETALQPLGREMVKEELKAASMQYHQKTKIIQFNKIKRWVLPAIAASIFIVSLVMVIDNLTEYNNPKNFKKVYFQKIK